MVKEICLLEGNKGSLKDLYIEILNGLNSCVSMGALWLKLRSSYFNSTGKGLHWMKINTHFMKLINKRVALFTAKLTSQPWLEKKKTKQS